MGGGFSFPTSLPSVNNVKRWSSAIGEKLPNMSAKILKPVGNAITSNTAKKIAGNVLAHEISRTIKPNERRRVFGGSKKKETSDKKKSSKKEKKSKK